MNFYQRKLYALLQAPEFADWGDGVLSQLECLTNDHENLKAWWNGVNSNQKGEDAQAIASASDRVNLFYIERRENPPQVTVRHPISGQKQQVTTLPPPSNTPDISQIKNEIDPQKVFWWFWRFYPEILAATQPDALLFPAHTVIPDCPLHSHQSTVSALTGAMFPEEWEEGDSKTPYLLIFSFSPVQEFIKSSRKFLDFWAGSYLLHYLSSRLCWHIAQELGPDAVIVPSLWSQEIIDALIVQKYPDFGSDFERLQEDKKTPVERFTDKTSTSLSTAGFPNMITVLVPGKEAAQKLGTELKLKLTEEWVKIGEKVQLCIREKVIEYLKKQPTNIDKILEETFGDLTELSDEFLKPYRHELRLIQQESCWEWNKLWNEQLKHTWEPYWAAVPLGSPDLPLIKDKENSIFDETWIKVQQEIAYALIDLPSEAEANVYNTLNVGTWWGSLQQRLRICLIAVKNTRNWQIPTAPGERSTISGQFSAVHPRFNYTKFAEGAGTHASSMRLFWLLISQAFPGLFNGSEKLNALELTKRMAWVYGGVAEELGVKIVDESLLNEEDIKEFETDIDVKEIDYEQLIRFPNLSSIAAARFASERPDLLEKYWQNLNTLLKKYWDQQVTKKNDLETYKQQKRDFYSKTRRPFHISNTDAEIKIKLPHLRKSYNGVMFSGKWLADDMGLKGDAVAELKNLVDKAHSDTGFGDSSPADWWVIILADGDSMGSYVSGEKLKKYRFYVEEDTVDKTHDNFDNNLFNQFLQETTKRMGPATHVGLNRALLDFSNRLVPYLTEKRFCGRVIYSGGDDVKVVLPLEDLPEYILSLRAAWCGGEDPHQEFTNSRNDTENKVTGYWHPTDKVKGLPKRPHFTMGKDATMSAGVIIAHKSVPLPTVLESLWEAEGERAKKIPGKDGLCFRVIYGGGNQLEALMKGELLETWWEWVKEYETYQEKLSPLLYRLAEELPRRAAITDNYYLFSKAAKVIMDSRDSSKQLEPTFAKIEKWLDKWEDWVKSASQNNLEPIGTTPEDLGKILRFTAFWIDKRVERLKWGEK
ncbi:type III-B CRISPR-associated protein Cas10/Cmr2 [Anabaena cylindrica FACHB-243]|uniref:CRISPR-associated protein, Crm2 family n=1 Tax=Anabaena cylindrica (strain ATCC 27899 / PCC 7122) TaxID=272123 RepID=K9ZQK2_ANACC|nr:MULTISPECIES: type III-B CRISPR-associated protein Cas10/Cmr2 [Anabaena]AFZ61069.1 CRISPR-associated protein, Crm2 family [Anabaena cylindrica PCC 7122]MBD2421802.1 type III-B CRISPR-associated protein Cas10/Cmr2 [Anabaena cylindrica FACHB-243]MBY5284586.1 type III-B CRISPR-associated protein Cas10/Cmr2 [Anabaena sp. CCAP 1446/1C]MBY5306427.1 type III-B CRISPR-associated protein Cas10/Cmr2 [Anabaena sp. CCAP 1446/1C]MCM2408059.1 type III-B CRISPR-associated protein Cas10/Cmr2 [Anabaena sp. 